MAATAGPRYAPEDPTLPKPWKGLVDGRTGNLYFWNPDTNVTQYERPVAASYEGSAPVKSSLPYISSSGQVQQRKQIIDNEDNGHTYGRISDGGMSQKIAVGGSDALVGAGSNGGNESIGGSMGAEAYRHHHEITVSGDDVPAPFMCFEISSFPSEILREVCVAGFSAPTPIQAQSWPIALQGRDIVAVAKTGSGKTLGYLVPGFMHIKQSCNNSQMGPTVLVLSPTRELATQIVKEVVKFGSSSRISCTCLYGGAPKVPQLRDLEKGVDIVVATPGRLNDIMEMGRVSLRQVSYLVLDEADRMLDMGFEPQIRKIVKEVPTCRQTLMFTATWPKEVRRIAADLLVKPVQVNIGNVDELVANKSITQYVEVLSPMDKQRRLEQILRSQEPGSKIIVFCATKKMCDNLAYRLTHRFGAAAIHGDKSQTERDHVLNQFRNGRSPVLVATDVAARGLDVKDIRVVINYDFPTGVEDYVHRIGRTGRAGATGLAYTFFSVQDAKYASDLIKILEGANQKVPPEIRDMAGHGVALGKPRRCSYGPRGQDGSGSGRCNSGYSGRGGWSSSAGADRGGRGANFDSGDRYDHGDYSQKRGCSRSRSRSRSPRNGRPKARSFHQMMMEKASGS